MPDDQKCTRRRHRNDYTKGPLYRQVRRFLTAEPVIRTTPAPKAIINAYVSSNEDEQSVKFLLTFVTEDVRHGYWQGAVHTTQVRVADACGVHLDERLIWLKWAQSEALELGRLTILAEDNGRGGFYRCRNRVHLEMITRRQTYLVAIFDDSRLRLHSTKHFQGTRSA